MEDLRDGQFKFQAYDFEIEHRPGSKHINADSLSRLPVVALIDSKNEHLFNLIAEQSKWGEESEEKQIVEKVVPRCCWGRLKT